MPKVRLAPRRIENRVQQDRIKPKAGAKPTAQERRHMVRVAAMPCLICRRPCEVHHVHSDGTQRLSKSHKRVVPLCDACHRTGPNAVHRISHSSFNEINGIDLLSIADELWSETCQLASVEPR